MYQSLFSKYLTEKKHTKTVSYPLYKNNIVYPLIDLTPGTKLVFRLVGWPRYHNIWKVWAFTICHTW